VELSNDNCQNFQNWVVEGDSYIAESGCGHTFAADVCLMNWNGNRQVGSRLHFLEPSCILPRMNILTRHIRYHQMRARVPWHLECCRLGLYSPVFLVVAGREVSAEPEPEDSEKGLKMERIALVLC
jgi:hypothetical protein